MSLGDAILFAQGFADVSYDFVTIHEKLLGEKYLQEYREINIVVLSKNKFLDDMMKNGSDDIPYPDQIKLLIARKRSSTKKVVLKLPMNKFQNLHPLFRIFENLGFVNVYELITETFNHLIRVIFRLENLDKGDARKILSLVEYHMKPNEEKTLQGYFDIYID